MAHREKTARPVTRVPSRRAAGAGRDRRTDDGQGPGAAVPDAGRGRPGRGAVVPPQPEAAPTSSLSATRSWWWRRPAGLAAGVLVLVLGAGLAYFATTPPRSEPGPSEVKAGDRAPDLSQEIVLLDDDFNGPTGDYGPPVKGIEDFRVEDGRYVIQSIALPREAKAAGAGFLVGVRRAAWVTSRARLSAA